MIFRNLTVGQQKILRVLAARRLPAPYGDPDALALIHADFARRTTAFGTIEITAAGKAALAAAREANADTGHRDRSDVTDPGTPNEPIEGTGL